MNTFLILLNGRMVDPANSFDRQADVWIQDGRIVQSGIAIPAEARVLDLKGKSIHRLDVRGIYFVHVREDYLGHRIILCIGTGSTTTPIPPPTQ